MVLWDTSPSSSQSADFLNKVAILDPTYLSWFIGLSVGRNLDQWQWILISVVLALQLFPVCFSNLEPLTFFPGGSVVKNLPASAGEAEGLGSVPKFGRSPGGGNDNSLQYSCLDKMEEPGGLQSMGSQELDMIDWLRMHEPLTFHYKII